ncbi:hypothetical protein [Embleya sp. MST-111070]|uniref:hypothetical protein n=1 Tax=Embleya sp. MST-111070 TaxID=3398231 RepID=UPI003F73C49A
MRRTGRLLVAAPASADEHAAREALLQVEGRRRTPKLGRLRHSPREVCGPGVGKVLDRYLEADALGAHGRNLAAIPAGRLHHLAHYACTARPQAVVDLTPDRRTAILVAFAATMRATAADEAIEVFDLLMADLARQSSHRAVKTRLRTVDAAALLLREA